MSITKKLLILGLSLVALIVACTSSKVVPTPVIIDQSQLIAIPATTQRTGDATKGWDYLINGDYISSGVPYDVFIQTGNIGNNELNRTGDATSIPYGYNLTSAANGVRIVTPNCLRCHAQTLENKFVIGLGSTTYDITAGQSDGIPQAYLSPLAQIIKNKGQNYWDAYAQFYNAYTAVNPYLTTDVVGANSADKLGNLLSLHRDKASLVWLNTATSTPNADVYPADVPAWWLLKKKNALYCGSWGRGDLARLMLSSGLLTMKDSSEARRIDTHAADVYAYLKTITAPKYTQALDQTLVAQGKSVFLSTCATCHGTYETANVSYPNYLVPASIIGTDSYLSNNVANNSTFSSDWTNTSWYAKAPFASQFNVTNGYIAPPLDGVWATAPYLHNGSVPTIEDLLNSSQRPKFWRKIIVNDAINISAYDYSKVGWQYTAPSSKTDKFTYDTTKPGYGNQGHTFGDALSAGDRKALIEYLKTL